MSNLTKNAVIYCRSACADQANPSREIIKQETECRLFAEKKGYNIVQVFHDDGHSGLTINRPAFRLMLVAVLASLEPYTVIATSIDRLARDVNDLDSICKIVLGVGGELVFSSDMEPLATARVA